MNILFLTLYRISDVNERNIYSDLMRKFKKEGHNVNIVTPTERIYKEKTNLYQQDGLSILKVKTLNLQKTSSIEKGLGILLFEYQYLRAINRFFKDISFDLVIYSTPPITLTRIIKKLKKCYNVRTYLILKDIFPQNAIDLEMMKPNGVIYKFFRNKEKKLYLASDFIGTMSPANVDYVVSHNQGLNHSKVEVCPTCIEVIDNKIDSNARVLIRSKYRIPSDIVVFIYGGNLGKPQGIDFLLEVLESNIRQDKVFFVIAGSGTEFPRIKEWFERKNPLNAILLSNLPKVEFDQLLQVCDVGMIFLDRRFTIPNYPSRLLSYLEFKMPIIAATDPCSDIGVIAMDNEYGFWSLSGDLESINKHITLLAGNRELARRMGENGYRFLIENYTVDHTYRIIMKHFTEN